MRTTLTLLLATFVATACVRTKTNPATGAVDLDIESPTQRGQAWDGSLTGQGAYTMVTGTTNAEVVDGRTTVNVALTGTMAGGSYPWHIHEGTCGSGGTMFGDEYAYTPLTPGSDGRATGTATVQGTLNEAKDYYVDVHASTTDLATVIACGDLDD